MRAGDWQRTDDGVFAGGVRLEPGEYELVLRPRNVVEGRTLPDDVGVVTLDTTVDDDLESEGLARDVVRLVQTERRGGGTARVGLHRLATSSPRPQTARGRRGARAPTCADQTLAVEVRVTVGAELSIEVTKTPCPSP